MHPITVGAVGTPSVPPHHHHQEKDIQDNKYATNTVDTLKKVSCVVALIADRCDVLNVLTAVFLSAVTEVNHAQLV